MEKIALFIIDMQNRWISPEKELFPAAHSVITVINKLRSNWRDKKQPVFYFTMVHEADGSTLSKFDSKIWNIRGSNETQIVTELASMPEENIIEKTRYSAFFKTDLTEILRKEGIEKCVITGYQARSCILATSIDAYQNDIFPIIVSDAILETDKEYLDFYLKVFAEANLLKTSNDVVALISENN